MEGYWSDKASSETEGTWKKKFSSKSGRPMTVTCKANISNIKEIMKSDRWYPMCDIAFHFKAFFKRTKDIWQINIALFDTWPKNGYEYKPLINF